MLSNISNGVMTLHRSLSASHALYHFMYLLSFGIVAGSRHVIKASVKQVLK